MSPTPPLTSTTTLLPATLHDGPSLVRTQHLGFASDPFTRASFPHVSLDDKIDDSIARWPANFSAPGALYMKSVLVDDDDNFGVVRSGGGGEVVGYSKWQADVGFLEGLKKNFSGGMEGGLEREAKGDVGERRDPLGLNDELAEEMSAKIRACRASVLGNRPYILLSLLCTLPSYRGKGVASQHLAWGTRVADEAQLPIWLDASPMSVRLYERFGFGAVGTVRSDLSIGSKGAESGWYVHTCMLREPCEREVRG